MRRSWDRLARRDALWAIDAAKRDWDETEFFARGRVVVANAMRRLGDRGGRRLAVEVGCGVGRTTVALAEHFEQVVGLDISAAMVEGARERRPPPNVRFELCSGADLEPVDDEAADLAFSQHVFQHVPEEAVVAGYLVEVARVLAPGGRALLQFDTRADGALTRLARALPDPRPARRRHMRRYPRDAARVRALAEQAGLAVEEEWGAGSVDHWLLAARATAD